MAGFWEGGAQAYREALQREFGQRFRALTIQLQLAATSEEKSAIQRAIDAERDTLKRCLAASDGCLY